MFDWYNLQEETFFTFWNFDLDKKFLANQNSFPRGTNLKVENFKRFLLFLMENFLFRGKYSEVENELKNHSGVNLHVTRMTLNYKIVSL